MWKNWTGQAALSFTHNHQLTLQNAISFRSAINKIFLFDFLKAKNKAGDRRLACGQL